MSNSDKNGTGKSHSTGLENQQPTSDLGARILAARKKGGFDQKGSQTSEHMTTHAKAARLGTEFFAAIIVGSAIGYFADEALGTTPWLLLVMVLVGFAAGVLNVVRVTAQWNADAVITPDMDMGPESDDEDEDGK